MQGYYAITYHDFMTSTVTEIIIDPEYLIPISRLLGMKQKGSDRVIVDDIEVVQDRIERIFSK